MANHSSRSSSFESQLSARAHLHRRNLTHSESALWQYLSGGQLGVAFKRQTPLDRYIVDFFAPSIGLIVEVDGNSHCTRRTADARRDRKLMRLGYRVLRLDAALVMHAPLVAVARIRAAIAAAM